MAWSISIRVVDSEGDGVRSQRVSVHFGLMSGHDSQYTDDDGWVEFSYDSFDEGEQKWVSKIYVEGEEVDSDFYIENGDTRSYTVGEAD